MQSSLGRILRGVFVVYLVVVHLALIYLVLERTRSRYGSDVESLAVGDPTERKTIPTPLPVPETFVVATPSPTPSELEFTPATAGLAIPVAGVRAEQLVDTFTSARSEDRQHDAIDIPAAAGTPVVAAADGEIVKFFDSERGGVTIYQTTADRKFVLYYAHLQRRADEIVIGMTVRKGTTIGYVGDTGNAGPGNYHLHFSIARITDPKRSWEGEYMNPYPILRYGLNLPQ